MPKVSFTLDGKPAEAEAGSTILEVAERQGVPVPTLCHDPRLKPTAACRVCLVEVENMRGLQTSCSVEVTDGMIVNANTEQVLTARKMVVELLLANGKHNCLSCESNGDCELQDAAYSLGIETPAFIVDTEDIEPDDSSEGIIIDRNKCIKCGRCVRVCLELEKLGVFDFTTRGFGALVTTEFGKPLSDTKCNGCGKCVESCPTGALYFKKDQPQVC